MKSRIHHTTNDSTCHRHRTRRRPPLRATTLAIESLFAPIAIASSGCGGNLSPGDGGETTSIVSEALSQPKQSLLGNDFDGDGLADLVTWCRSGSCAGTWTIRPSHAPGTLITKSYGAAGDIPVPRDYDKDGKSDLAYWRPSTGEWFVQNSSSPELTMFFGIPGDIPVPADYDGDGSADIAVFRPAGQFWYVQNGAVPWNTSYGWSVADIPVPADYDGDKKADLAFWTVDWAQQGYWNIWRTTTGLQSFVQWGQAGDIPVPADYDGDGKVDIAVFRPSTNQWLISASKAGPLTITWNPNGSVPVPADYDGDGLTDLSVWASGPSIGKRLIVRSKVNPLGTTKNVTSIAWGSPSVLELPFFTGQEPAALLPDPYLVAMDYDDSYANLMRLVPATGGSVQLPSYSVPTKAMDFIWYEPLLSDWEIGNIEAGLSPISVKLSVNGSPISPEVVYLVSKDSSYGCPAGQTCLLTSVPGSDLPGGGQYTVNLDVVIPNGPQNHASGSVTILTNSVPPPEDYFGMNVLPTFQSSACRTCHMLGDVNTLFNQHVGVPTIVDSSFIALGPGQGDYPAQSSVKGGLVACSRSCHVLSATTLVPGVTLGVGDPTGRQLQWMAPGFDEALNWSTMTPDQICKTVLGNLPTTDAMRNHFFEDARVAWAVNSGVLPFNHTVDKAFPGSYAGLVQNINGWIANGLICPQFSPCWTGNTDECAPEPP